MKFVKPLNETEIETLQAMHHYHPSRRARMRAHCILLSHQHYSINDMARLYQISRRRVSAWINRWQDAGLVGLYDQPRCGRPLIYNEQEQRQVDQYLKEYPQDVKKIVEEMAQATQKRVSTKTMKRYIKKRLRLETYQKDNGEISRSHEIQTKSTAHQKTATARGSR